MIQITRETLAYVLRDFGECPPRMSGELSGHLFCLFQMSGVIERALVTPKIGSSLYTPGHWKNK